MTKMNWAKASYQNKQPKRTTTPPTRRNKYDATNEILLNRVKNYTGSNSFINKMKSASYLSWKQIRVIEKILKEEREEKRSAQSHDAADDHTL